MNTASRILLSTATIALGLGLTVSASAHCHSHHCHREVRHLKHKEMKKMARGERHALRALFNGRPGKAAHIMNKTENKVDRIHHRIEHKRHHHHYYY